MGAVNKENYESAVNALVRYYNNLNATGSFTLNGFLDFMEPQFESLGYREVQKTTDKTDILILSDDAASDFILTTGAIREIRRIYPDAYITLVVGTRAFNLAECCPYVDEIMLNEKNFRLQDFLAVYKSNMNMATFLLKKHFDICFAFAHHWDSLFLMYMSGARIRVTHAFENDNEDVDRLYGVIPLKYVVSLATNFVDLNIFGKHMADLNFNLPDNIINIPVSNREIELWYTASDMSTAKSIVNNTNSAYALCMGGSGPHRHYKHYPPEKYAKLLEMIADKEPNAKFFILGGGNIDEESRDMLKAALKPKFYKERVVDLIGKLTYRQSATVLSLCNMYIGNNTGTMHAAAAMKCPVLEISCFSADLPKDDNALTIRWRAYNVPAVIVQPAHALPECKHNDPFIFYGCRVPRPHCITQITPETIFKGFKLLKQRIAQNNIEPLYIH